MEQGLFSGKLAGGKVWKELMVFGALIAGSWLFAALIGSASVALFFGLDVLAEVGQMIFPLSSEAVKGALLLQAVAQLGMFVLPSVVFLYLFRGNYTTGRSLKGHGVATLLSAALVFLALPLITQFYDWNQALVLPESLAGLESWMKASEEKAALLVESFLADSSYSALGRNLLVMAVIPAIAEELLFRGVLQQLIARLIGRNHAAVWITAFIFSAIHLQFYGFLPRFLIGVLLGYLFHWSGSLWLPVIAHFANNAASVVAGFLFARGISSTPYEEVGHFDGILPFLISLLLIAAVLFFIRRSYNTHLPS